MKLHAAAVLAAALVRTAEAGPEDKCTFPTRGDGSDPACVWDDYTTMWLPSFEHKRCCQLDATDNALCDPATNMLLTQAQCDEINQTNYDCDSASSYYAVGFTSTNWACEDYAPDCLPTLACDTENGYSGTPWIMCNADGGEFEMHGCVRGAADLDAHNEVYLPYKYMGLDLGGGNKKTSLDSAVASCDETNCAAFTAANGACNQLGECSTMGQYWVYQDAEYTDVYPDVSMDLYVNPFRWMGPPAEPQVATVDDRDNDPDGGIRISDLDFYTPMFDCYNTNKGFFKYRQQTIAELNEAMSATGLVAAQFRFTQTVYDYIVNDLGVDPDLLTSGAGEAKTTLDSAADPVGSSEYFGGIDDGTLSADVAELDGLFVGGPLMCNINNGQGCTLEGCAWMCAQTHGCAAFSIVDFCFEADVDPLRPTCAVVDDLVARSGGSATFDRSKRAVCAFHHNGEPNSAWTYAKDGAKGRAAVIVERPTNGDGSWDGACGAYNPNRCGECLECTDDSSWLLQGGCQGGAPACKQPRMTLDVSTEWGYFKNDDTWTCDLCPNHCVACSDADQCNVQSCTGSAFVRNDDGTGCRELGCNVSVADFPASSVGDAAGAVSLACEEGLEVEPYDSCDIKCNTSFYQSAGSSLTAQCNGTTLQMDFPAITCSPCSEAGCVTCPSDTCTECEEGFVLSNLAQCEVATCPLPAEVGPVCEACPAHEYGTISWDAAASAWDTSACRTCGNVDSNCLNCNGTSLLDAVCIECDVGYTLDENDACIEDQQCPEGQEGTVVYDLVAAAFNFSDCATNDACPRDDEAAPDCWDCPEGYRGGVVWEWTNTTHGYWSDAQCDLVACPTEGETSPACTACPWGYSGTAYWDDETETWAGCVSNDFGLSRAPRSANRAAARSTTPAVASRGVRVQRAADGMTVESVQAAPYTLNRQSSAYFHKNMGAFSSAESVWNCPPGFGGADCSLRLCPQSPTTFAAGADALGVAASEGLFWTTHLGQKSSASFHGRHAYRECAGRGVCDYVTGECDCFPGFTGRGCRRRECPNDCSGHGVCVDDATTLYHNVHAAGAVDAMPPDVYPDSATSADPNLWAADHQQACMCDGGWTGHDCSLRLCPVGDDPETHCADEMAYDVQQITCTGLDKDVDHFFSLAYTTPRGVRYNTPPVLLHTFQGEGDNLTRTTDSLQTALESLPNFAIPSVEVSTAFTAIAGAEFTATMLVTFSDPVNSGEQPLLDVVYTPRCDAGASSYFVNTDTSFTCSLERVAQASDLREQAECASRGVCNTRTGECQCFDGYEGVACETISATI